jgi:hypothetical protein
MPPLDGEARLAHGLLLEYISSHFLEEPPPSSCGVNPGGFTRETTCGCAVASCALCSAAAATEVAAVALSEDEALPLPRLTASIGEDVNSGKCLKFVKRK